MWSPSTPHKRCRLTRLCRHVAAAPPPLAPLPPLRAAAHPATRACPTTQMYVAENINQLENGTTTTPRMRGAPKPVDGDDSGAAAGAGSGAGAGAATAAAPAAQPRRPPGPPPKKSPGSAGASALAGAGGFIGQGMVPSRAPEPGSVEDLEQKAADAGWELATDADTLIKCVARRPYPWTSFVLCLCVRSGVQWWCD